MEVNEYGGYIEFETYRGHEFHPCAIALNSGRGCLEYLLKVKHFSKIYLPYFLCASVKNTCDKLQVPVEFYHTDMMFQPEFNKKLTNEEILYIVNYYGQISNEQIEAFSNRYGNVIIDNAQAFFQAPVKNIDTLYTCRKFFGVSDGAYLYTNCGCADNLDLDYSYERMHFLLGRYEKEASLFYDEYVKNNKSFEAEPVKRMSKLTHNLLRGIDYEFVSSRRTENFAYLHERFKSINRLKLTIPTGAFMYPLYIENGAEIRKCLQEEKIYIPILWPDVMDICSPECLEYDMANNILPLPVDQRYDTNDMKYIADEIERLIALQQIM